MKRRVFVIGLDGATWDVILPLVEAGAMPVFKDLLDSGSHGVLRSTLPCVTPPAWGSFLTGASPARHGVLDFTQRLDTDIFEFVSFKNLRIPKLWHALEHFGRRPVFLGVPFTYPPDRIGGVIVPGPPVPRRRGMLTQPPELARELEERIPGYTAELSYSNKDEILGEIHRALTFREELARWQLERGEWDFFMVTFIATDRLHHKMWHQPKTMEAFYRRLDGVLGGLLSKVDPGACVLMMSDHGFTSVHTKFFPNQWLAEKGYLAARFVRPGKEWNPRFLNPTARRRTKRGKVYGWRALVRLLPGCGNLRWTIDLSRTKAFSSFGHLAGVFINLEGRYEQGIVKPGAEYEALRDELIGGLSALRDPRAGDLLFGRVVRREELFDGPAAERAPDVVCVVSDPGYRLRSNLGVSALFQPFLKPKSYHAPDGILYARGPGISRGLRLPPADIQDVAPLILHLMGLPKLSTMDGTAPRAMLDPSVYGAEEQAVCPADELPYAAEGHAFSEEDQAAIAKDLEALGYL